MSSPFTPAPQGVPGVLLVHGAWHTGHMWTDVAEDLRAEGVPVAVVELHRGSLEQDTAAALLALSEIARYGPAVACGHSYGGTVITGLPPDRLAHLVYVCATMPALHETTLGLMGTAPPTQLFDAIRWTDEPQHTATIDPALAGEVFYGHVDPGQRPPLIAELVPQNMTPGDQQPASVAWQQVPSTYICCTNDHALHPSLQRRLSARATFCLEWDSDHSPHVTYRAELTALLTTLARSPQQ